MFGYLVNQQGPSNGGVNEPVFCKGVLVLKKFATFAEASYAVHGWTCGGTRTVLRTSVSSAFKKVADGVGPAHICGYMDGGWDYFFARERTYKDCNSAYIGTCLKPVTNVKLSLWFYEDDWGVLHHLRNAKYFQPAKLTYITYTLKMVVSNRNLKTSRGPHFQGLWLLVSR